MTNAFKPVLALSLFFYLAGLGMTNAQTPKKLKVVTEHYPPYEMQEPVNGLSGFDYEVMIEIFTRLGYEIDTIFLPWKRALEYAKDAKTVGILTCAYTDVRSKYILFSDPISAFTNGIYQRAGYDGVKPVKLADLNGQKVASITGYASLAILKEMGFNPAVAPNTKSAVRMLLYKRFDHLYVSRQATDFVIKQMGVSGAVEFHPISQQDFHFCFSKRFPGVPALRDKFNAMLKEIRAEGTYEAIHKKYR